MKPLILGPNLSSHKLFIFSVLWINFFGIILSSIFPIKLLNDLGYSMHVFYKVDKKNKFIVVEKISRHFCHYNLINKEELRI